MKLNGATQLGPRLFAGVRLAALPLQLGLEGGYAWFPRWETATVNRVGAALVDMRALSLGLGARFGVDLSVRVSLQLALTLGVQLTQLKVSGPGQRPVEGGSRGPLARGAAGVGFRVPGGQLVLQLEYGFAPLAGQNIQGNALGAAVALGYFVDM